MSTKAIRKTPKIGWVDMCVTEPETVAQFYSEIIGWGMEPCIEDEEHTSYAMTNQDGEEVIGVCDEAVFTHSIKGWTPYVEVDNLEECVAKIEPAGGTIIQQGKRSCLFKDPSGAPMMIHQIPEWSSYDN